MTGLRVEGEGYPNAVSTISLLAADGTTIVDFGKALPPDLHLWRLRGMGPLRQAMHMLRMAVGNAASVLRMASSRRARGTWVYVPYPGMFALWILSWVPRALRPRCIVDAYISVWDASFRDRSATGTSFAGRLVRTFEGRALRAATTVLVDTQANRDHFIADFGIEADCIRAFPLAVDESRFLAIGERADSDIEASGRDGIRVLFVGTLIPLHGVERILSAAKELVHSHPNVTFRIVGDGQLGATLERFIADNPDVRLEWVREWRSLDCIAAEIGQADICLGVFGGDGKAARVLPFKLYMYLAGGRAVISQQKCSTPDGVPPPPIVPVEPEVAGSIAAAIVDLVEQGLVARQRLGRDARDYYRAHLSNAEVLRRWNGLIG